MTGDEWWIPEMTGDEWWLSALYAGTVTVGAYTLAGTTGGLGRELGVFGVPEELLSVELDSFLS